MKKCTFLLLNPYYLFLLCPVKIIFTKVYTMETTRPLQPTHTSRRRFFNKIEVYLYLLPALLFVGIFLLYPAVYTLYISFTDWDGLNEPSFIGLQN